MTLNFALLGPGRISDRFLAPALAAVPGARLWSVLGRTVDKAREFAARHGAAAPSPAYDDLDALLKDPALDAVLIATPDPLHASQGIACAQAKKHVLVEKPMVTSEEDGRALIEACQQAKVTLGVAYHLRWHAGHRLLIEKIHAHALGELRHLRVRWTYQAQDASNWRARPETGRWWSLAGMGTHALDLARWIALPLAGEVVALKSVLSQQVFGQGNDETALLSLRFASGVTAEILVSVVFDSEPLIEVYGSKGSALATKTLGPHGKGSITLLGEELLFTPEDPYQGEIADFVAAIKEGRPPEVDGEEGLRNVRLLLQADPADG